MKWWWLWLLLLPLPAFAEVDSNSALHFGVSAASTSLCTTIIKKPLLCSATVLGLGVYKEVQMDNHVSGADIAFDALGVALGLHIWIVPNGIIIGGKF